MQEQQCPRPGTRPASPPRWDGGPNPHTAVRSEPHPGAEFDESRLRALRKSAFAASLLSDDRFARFWFRDMRRLCLFLALMREAAWLRGGEWGCFAMTSLARRSKMSVARVHQVLSLGRATGDFLYRRDPRDARLVMLEPSPLACQALEALVASFSAALSAFLGRPDPLPRLGPAERQGVYVAFIDTVLATLTRAELDDRQTGSTTFLLAMLDLWLHSPVARADFVRREAVRLQVTQATMRNVLNRAEQIGLVARTGRMIRLTEPAQQRVAAAAEEVLSSFSTLQARTEGRALAHPPLPAASAPAGRGHRDAAPRPLARLAGGPA